MKIYAGNHRLDEAALREAFGAYGEVADVAVMRDRESGAHRGFAFVTMAEEAAGRAALEGLNGARVQGHALVLSEARPVR